MRLILQLTKGVRARLSEEQTSRRDPMTILLVDGLAGVGLDVVARSILKGGD